MESHSRIVLAEFVPAQAASGAEALHDAASIGRPHTMPSGVKTADVSSRHRWMPCFSGMTAERDGLGR